MWGYPGVREVQVRCRVHKASSKWTEVTQPRRPKPREGG